MVFSSTVFLFLFLPAVLIAYYLPPRKYTAWRNGVLLVFSLIFYAWGEPVFVFLMLFSILLNWLLVLGMERAGQRNPGGGGRKFWMIAATVFDVLLLGIFKYASFFSRNLALLTGNDALIVNIALPIGISFFTFQLMSYVFDVYYGNAEAQHSPFRLALYISLFSQLIAGPIVRYRQIAEEIATRRETLSDFAEGMRRFVYGLGKKVLLANFFAQITDNVFDYLRAPSVLTAWLGIVTFMLQVYFDFSGYSDMAIGLGRMFGFHFLENFNYPYISNSMTDYARRWHMSLGNWFRDYVYFPMGGSRAGTRRQIWNLFVVWLLTGLWHGANWTFVLWGLISFLALVVEKLTGFHKKIGPLCHLYTLFVLCIADVFFRASDISAGILYLGHMFGVGANGVLDGGFLMYLRGTWLVLLVGMVGATPLPRAVFRRLRQTGAGWVESLWLLLVFGASILEVVSESYNPFIYFNF